MARGRVMTQGTAQGTRRAGARGLRAVMLGAVLVLAGCAEQFRNHGYVPTDEDLAAITVGVDDRSSVRNSIGAPSSGGVLAGGDYYYVRSRVRNYGMLAPEVVAREVVAVSFTEAGTVANIERFDLSQGRIVPLSRRVTTTTVTNRSFLRQLVASIGRISTGQVLE